MLWILNIRVCLVFGALCLGFMPANAASITLEWEPVTTNVDSSPITDLAGYRLFQSSSSLLNVTTQQALLDESIIKTAVLPNTTSHVMNNLSSGSTYFFRVTAFDTSGNESGFNVDNNGLDVEVSTFLAVIPMPVPGIPPQITDINLSISSVSAVISWQTDIPTIGQVEYDATTFLGISTTLESTYSEKHTALLHDLLPGTTYFFKITCQNVSNTQFSTPVRAFFTKYLLRHVSFDIDIKPDIKYMSGKLMYIRIKVDDTEKHAPVRKTRIYYSEILDTDVIVSTYTHVHEMKKIGDGVYAGYVDTRDLTDNAGALRYKVELLQDDGAIVTTQENQLYFDTSVEVSSDATGAFEVEDGNPFDGELKVNIPQEEAIERVEFKRLISERYRVKIEEEIDNKHGDKPVCVYDVSVPGRTSTIFNRQASLTLVYNDLDGSDVNGDGMPDGDGYADGTLIPEQDLRIFWYDGVSWRLVGGEVDTVKNTVTARVKHFSVYGLLPAAQVPVSVKAHEKFLSPTLQDGINDFATFGMEAEEVTIFDVTGRKVFNATQEQSSTITWDCRDGSGNIVESGIYIAKIKQKDGKTVYQSFAVVK